MKKFEKKAFSKQLKLFLALLEKENFTDYVLFKINFKNPYHSDIDILTTKPTKLSKILEKFGYQKGYDLRSYKKGKIPIDTHDQIKWNIIRFNTGRLMKNRVMREMDGSKFYYLSRFDDFITKSVHDIYTLAVETKWKIGKILDSKK
jgi:hypothetical protein